MKRVFIILVLLVLVSGCTQVMETPTTQNQTDNNMTGETFEQAWNDTGETTVNKTEDPEEKIDISKDQNAMASLEREIDILTEGGNIIGYDHYTRMRETLDSIDINATDYDRLSAKLEPLNPEGQGSSAAKDIPDACEGAEGNGDQIVSGPSGPTDYDPDNPFRSLTVHPTNPDLIYLGTERNGFLKST
ncbi:MAG: membrane lipoprotein lipid attachment site-containing protein, partial [Candidatus Peribacteraceae bacterium]|nr:membrane lipoprotein lipid attachment site-containing protein [Candidatus Peribacteraceae bacterium]